MDRLIINNEEKFLQGKLEGYSLKSTESKFNSEGKPLYFPGCTIICKILKNSELFNEISTVQLEYKDFNPNNTYTYLPSSSFHMTLFDCCNIDTINTSSWPKDVKTKDNYKKIALELYEKIKEFIFPDKFNLKLKKLFGGYSMILEGATPKDEKILRDCRNELSKLLGIKFLNHETYSFHITLAYILRELNEQEVKNLFIINNQLCNEFIKKFPIITIKDPAMCFFENMLEFKKI